jgi:carboxymethylenebutenolidase
MEKITFGKDALTGYVIGEVGAPGVVVIQEWWGINDLVKAHAAKIAAHGYRCLIPDVYHGEIGVNKEEASHLLSKLDWPRAVQEVTQAVEHLKAEGAARVGVIGFCMGGALSVAAAQHSGVACAQPFYGLPGPEIAQPENVKAPVLMHAGELDTMTGFSDPAGMTAYAAQISAAGGDAQCHVYPACGHAFLNDGEEGEAKRDHMGFPHPPTAQRELAWERVVAFFDKHLKA